MANAIIADDDPQTIKPKMQNVGGVYRATPTAYTDGDATILQTDVNGNMNVNVATSTAGSPTVTSATGAAAIATSTAVGADSVLEEVTCTFDIAPTTSEDFTITVDALDGAAYDNVVYLIDPSDVSATSIRFQEPVILEAGDKLTVAYTNTDTRTYGLRVITRGV